MKKLFRKIINRFRPKKDELRQKCVDAYGEEFGEIYDNLNSGIPVGGFVETAIFLEMIETVKEGNPLRITELKIKGNERL